MTILSLILPFFWTFLAPPNESPVRFIFPEVKYYISRAPTFSLTIEYDADQVYSALLLKPYNASQSIGLRTEADRMEFATHLYRLIPEDVLLQRIDLTTNRDSETYRFTQDQRTDLEKFWVSPEIQSIWETVHDERVTETDIEITGWRYSELIGDDDLRSMFGDMFIFTVDLDPKENEYKVLFVDSSSTVVTYDSISVYRLIPTDWDGPPEPYETVPFHGTESQETCVTCHGELEETCDSCHQSFTELQSYHPAADDCALCHDLSSDLDSKLIEDQEYNSELCYMCHGDKQEQTESLDVVHGTVDDCQVCHDPHGSRQPTLVRTNTREICASCHEDDANRRHPVRSHPFEGPDERNRPGKPFTCSSCHEPHASQHSRLFRFETLPICGNCHS